MMSAWNLPKVGGPRPVSGRDALALVCFRKLTLVAAVQVLVREVEGASCL